MDRLKRLTAKMLGKTFIKVLVGEIKDDSNIWRDMVYLWIKTLNVVNIDLDF